MDNVIILALNSKYIHSSLAPWYLKAEVPTSMVLEHTVNENVYAVAEDVLIRKPKILAISVYIWNVEYAEKLLAVIKEKSPETVTVVGGPEVSYNAKDVLDRCNFIDYVISGEGELPFLELCKYVLHGEKSPLNGISYGDNIAEPYIGSGTPKSPYTEEYFKNLNGRIAYFESSRGCPYSCAYCLSGRCEGLRFFDIEYVRENLVKLANGGSKTIKFVDRTFNSDRKRAIDIFSFIIEKSGVDFPSDVCFHFELSGDLLDDETISVLKRAPSGLFQFEIGIQSFCRETINAIHRVTKNEILKDRISQLVALGNAHVHTDLIAGLPYENYTSFINSFNEAYSLGANMLQLGFLKILHGTELEDRAVEYGFEYSDKPPYEVYQTPWLSANEFSLLKITENAVDRLHNSQRFKRTIALCLPLFESAYDFFFECGKAIKDTHTLDELTDKLYEFLGEFFKDDTELLRDALVCDRLATNSSKGLPSSIYRPDVRIAKVKKALNEDDNMAEKKNVRRNIAILYGAKKAVYADYDVKNHSGEYKLGFTEYEI